MIFTGGFFAEKFGGKWVFGCGALLAAIASIFTPLAARSGMGWLIAARVVLGMGQVKLETTTECEIFDQESILWKKMGHEIPCWSKFVHVINVIRLARQVAHYLANGIN